MAEGVEREPLTPDAQRWLARAGVDRSSWEGDDIAAVLNRAVLNRSVEVELAAIREAFDG